MRVKTAVPEYPLFLGAVPVLVIARRRKFGLARLHLRFLKADDVRAEALEDVREALAEDGPETIDIPRYQFQNDIPRIFLSKSGSFSVPDIAQYSTK